MGSTPMDVQQTNSLIDDYLGKGGASSEFLVLVANFSGASKKLFNQFQDTFRQIWIRLSGKPSKFSTILWVEPDATDSKDLFKRLYEIVAHYKWFQKLFGTRTKY